MNKVLNFFLFFVIGIFLLLDFNGFKFLTHLKEDMEVRIFLTTDAKTDSLRKKIRKEKKIDTLIFINKEYALREFEKEFGTPFIPDKNPLPASFRILLKPKYKNPKYLNSLTNSIEAMSGVKKLIYGKEYLKNVYTINIYFAWISAGMSGLLFFLILFSIITTSNQKALILKNETSMLKSFGISHWKLKIKFGFKAFFENFVLSTVIIGILYCIYKLLLGCNQTYSLFLFFLPISLIVGFIGVLSILPFIISLIRKI